QLLTDLIATPERKRPEVQDLAAVPDLEHVEHQIDDGHLRDHTFELARPLRANAWPQTLEVRLPALVEGDDLAVEHHVVERQRAQRTGDIGIVVGAGFARAVVESRALVGLGAQDADAVELELVEKMRAL